MYYESMLPIIENPSVRINYEATRHELISFAILIVVALLIKHLGREMADTGTVPR